MIRHDPTASTMPLRFLQVIVLASLAGFATIGLHPEWLDPFPSVARLRPQCFSAFAQVELYFSFLVLVLFLRSSGYGRWSPALACVCGLGFLSEYCGTKFGLPFGKYEYSNLMGLKLAGVPIVVPMSWFTMGFASYALVGGLVPGRLNWMRHVMAASLLTCWDLALDPAMSRVNQFWQWEGVGVYYGVPWTNFVGWMVTAMAISLVFELTLREPVERLDRRWLAEYYLTNFLLSWGMMLAAGLWMGVVVSAAVLMALRLIAQAVGREGRDAAEPSWNPLQ